MVIGYSKNPTYPTTSYQYSWVFTMAKWDKSPSHHNKIVIYKDGSGEFPERKRLVWMSFYPSKGGDGNKFKNRGGHGGSHVSRKIGGEPMHRNLPPGYD